MKAKLFFWFTIFLVFTTFTACENPQVQEILRDASVLDGISIYADESENHIQLSPVFSADNREYTVRVPYPTKTITIKGSPHKDGGVSYSQARTASFDTVNTFDFDPDLDEMVVYLRSDRKHMDSNIYTLVVKRGADVWLQSLDVLSGPDPDAITQSGILMPNFHPEEAKEYIVNVPSPTTHFRVTCQVKNGITIRYGLGTDEINISGQTDELNLYYAEFAFPNGTGSCNVRIKLESAEPEEDPLVYTLTLKKPPEVIIMGGGGKISIPGFSEPYYFNYGEQVIFTAEPEFGTALTELYYETDGGDTKYFYLTEAAKTELSFYAFNMPDESLTLHVKMDAVPASTSPVVAYVREGGTGDGSSWKNAAGNLQQIIEKFGSSPFTEIWIAGGTIKPDWSWWVDTTDTSDDPAWATDLTGDERKDKRNWAFVLKDGVKLYGGFRGMETERKLDRLWGANKAETVLSGDVGTEGNAKHVLIAVNVSTPCVLEGLTISGGGTIISTEPDVTIAGKSIWARDGGGLYNENSKTVLRYVTFLQNLGFIGAGMVNYSGSVAAINCRFINNSGNMIFYGNDTSGSTNTVFIGTSVSGNTAGNIINTNSGNTCLVNVTMLGNNGDDLYQSGVGSVSVYNSMYQTESGTIAGVDNHVFPGPGTPAPDDIIDMGNDAHYPVQANGTVNSSSPASSILQNFSGFPGDEAWRDTEIYRPLLKDLNGKDRFKGGSIDIGAAEDQS